MSAIKLVIDRVNKSRIEKFLHAEGVKAKRDEQQTPLDKRLDKLIKSKAISKAKLNSLLFDELMYGNQRYMRCYELRSVRKINDVDDWEEFLDKNNCPSMNFNKILDTHFSDGKKCKICAMSTIEEKGRIKRVSILFVYHLQVRNRKTGTYGPIYSYLPVTINFEEKKLLAKVCYMLDVYEDLTPPRQLDYVIDKLKNELDFTTKAFSIDSQSTLYRMSKALFDDFFMHLPNYADVQKKKNDVPEIVDSLLKDITLSNVILKNDMKTMDVEVIDVEEEVFKLLQQVALYDYLSNHLVEKMLENTDHYISRIRFSDTDNLAVSLNGESDGRSIFDAKTFMCARNSLDLVRKIVSLVVTFKDNSKSGGFQTKYDSSDGNYLVIHILHSKYYTEADWNMIWGLYKQYEKGNKNKANTVGSTNNSQAM